MECVDSLSWSAGSTHLVSGYEKSNTLRVWSFPKTTDPPKNIPSQDGVKPLHGLSAMLCLSPLMTRSQFWTPHTTAHTQGVLPKTVLEWMLSNSTKLDTELFGHSSRVFGVAWLPTDKGVHLASCGKDRTVRVWQSQLWGSLFCPPKCVAVLEGHKDAVVGVSWSPKARSGHSRLLASCSWDCTVRLWALSECDGVASRCNP